MAMIVLILSVLNYLGPQCIPTATRAIYIIFYAQAVFQIRVWYVGIEFGDYS